MRDCPLSQALTDEEAQRMERGLRRLLNTPPKPHGKNPDAPSPRRKERPADKGRGREGKTRP